MNSLKKKKIKYSKDTNITATVLVSKLFYHYMLFIANKVLDEFDLTDEKRKEVIEELIKRSDKILTDKTISKIYKDLKT